MTTAPAPHDRVRVLLLLPSLNGGGAERLALLLLANMDRSRFDVRMGLLRRGGAYLPLVASEDVYGPSIGEKFLDFDRGNRQAYALTSLVPALVLTPLNVLGMLRQFRPHVVLSFRKGMSVITLASVLLYGRSRVRWIAREGNNALAVIDDELGLEPARRAVRRLMSLCYRSADRTLTLCHEMADGLERGLSLDHARVRVIHNAVDIAEVERRAEEAPSLQLGAPYVVAAGRLERQKGFDILISAFAASRHRRTHRLVILGEGNELEALAAQARALGVEDRVIFAGWQDNPWALMRRAELFVLSSRWEGFANVVIEAMASRVPVVVSDCDYGPKEIVRDGRDGLVVPRGDPFAMRDAIDRVLDDAALRARFVESARVRAREFDVSRIVERYQELFLEAASELSTMPSPASMPAASSAGKDAFGKKKTITGADAQGSVA